MNYRPEIDGLRCIAVLSVVVHHAGFHAISGGFLGVDIFFVISGYLITRIILGEMKTGSFSLVNFYKRRVRRILPAVVFVVFCTIPLAWMLMVPFQFHEFSRSVLATLFFASNIFFWRNSGYFDPSSEHKPLLHTWSLAVEEQFYLFFPVLVLLVWPFGRNRVLMTIIALSAISLLIAEFAPRRYETASFFLLPTRAWEIGVGCILAFFPTISARLPLFARESGAILGLTAILASLFLLNDRSHLPGFLSLLPVLGTVIVIAFATRGTYVASLLGSKGFVAVGAISFSLYLWHQPIFVFSRLYFGSLDGWVLPIALIGVSVVLSVLTYRFIETPFRGRESLKISFPAVAGFVLIFYALLSLHSGFALYEERNGRFLFSDNAEHPALIDGRVENARRATWINDPDNRTLYLNTLDFPGPRILVIGDSHSTDVYNIIESQKDDLGVFPARVPLFDGCMGSHDPLTAEQETRECISHYLDVDAKELFEPADHVVITLFWGKFYETPVLMDIMVSTAIEEIQKRGKVAVVSTGAYHSEPMLPLMLWKLFRQEKLVKPTADSVAFDVMHEGVQQINQRIEILSRAAGAEIFDRFDVMCSISLEQCHALTNQAYSMYTDSNHITLEGAIFLGELARERGTFDVFLPNP